MIERKFLAFLPDYSVLIMYGLFVVTVVVFLYGTRRQLSRFGVTFDALVRALFEKIRGRPRAGLADFIKYVLLQKKTQKTALGTALHSPIFFGFAVLLVGTAFVALDEDLLVNIGRFRFLRGGFYLAFEWVLDTAGLLMLFGLGVALYRRLISRPSSLETEASDYLVLGLLLVIVLSGFLLEGLRLKLDPVPYAGYSYVGQIVSGSLFGNLAAGSGLATYRFLWFLHLVAGMSFLALIPFTKLNHLLLLPVNLLLFPPRAHGEKAKLSTPFNILEIDEEDEEAKAALDKVGVGSVADLRWEERLQIYSCLNCGRCEEVCPAAEAGRALSPRQVMQKVRREIGAGDEEKKFFEEVVGQEEMWGCTNCQACLEACPCFLRQVDHFLNFRRFILNDAFEDETKISLFESIERNGNPYRLPSYERVEWLLEREVPTVTEKDEFEYLYFLGCSSCYDSRGQDVTRAMIDILNFTGVDFALLGEEERCCGEPAKRMGEEGLFQMTAVQNIEVFKSFGVRKILVHCPHCYNTLKHEYRDFQGDFEVVHHSQLILDLMERGKLDLSRTDEAETITFHDPCNLGRLNGLFDPPREILRRLGKLREMGRSKEDSFCCGGGGGNSFYRVEEEKRISQIRLEEALQTGASVISAACPFCLIMFEDVKGGLAKEVEVPEILDLAEVVARRIRGAESGFSGEERKGPGNGIEAETGGGRGAAGGSEGVVWRSFAAGGQKESRDKGVG